MRQRRLEIVERPGRVGGEPDESSSDPALGVGRRASEALRAVALRPGPITRAGPRLRPDEVDPGLRGPEVQGRRQVGDRAGGVPASHPRKGPVDVCRREAGPEPERLVEVEARLLVVLALQLHPAAVEVSPGRTRPECDRDGEAVLGLGEAAPKGVALAEVHPEGEVLRGTPARLG